MDPGPPTEPAPTAPGRLGPAAPGQRAHFCAACNFPSAKHARCAPCLHVFCLSCAAAMARCGVCAVPITKLEPIPAGTALYVSPATLQGFRTEADFARHVAHVRDIVTGGGGQLAG